jgi:clan AA aspartic protease
MGAVYTEITLKNAGDEGDVKRGFMKENEVRQTTVTALVDTGAPELVINSDLRIKLGLGVERVGKTTLADGSLVQYQVTEGVRICWKDRDTITRAVVLPKAEEVLLGQIPLESMDLIVHPKKEELVGAHGDTISRPIHTIHGR